MSALAKHSNGWGNVPIDSIEKVYAAIKYLNLPMPTPDAINLISVSPEKSRFKAALEESVGLMQREPSIDTKRYLFGLTACTSSMIEKSLATIGFAEVPIETLIHIGKSNGMAFRGALNSALTQGDPNHQQSIEFVKSTLEEALFVTKQSLPARPSQAQAQPESTAPARLSPVPVPPKPASDAKTNSNTPRPKEIAEDVMTAIRKFDITVKSAIIQGSAMLKPLNAELAPNQNQANRVTGFIDGIESIIAQRPGKGGMDFNKLLGGKVYAVAADGISPVFEKDGEDKTNPAQKFEQGKPLFSSSGFYLLSSKEYPAIHLMEAYTLLRKNGEQLWTITTKQFVEKQRALLNSAEAISSLSTAMEEMLGDQFNLVAPHNQSVNKRRKRLIDFAQGESEERGEPYAGATYSELPVSTKDGNPLVMFYWKAEGGEVKGGAILREADVIDDSRSDGFKVTKTYTAKEAVENFWNSLPGKTIRAAVNSGQKVWFGFTQGNVIRTSVSFRRKAENTIADAENIKYGDGVYILGTLKGWTRGIVSLMHSQHPKFPAVDYEENHYVASCRQGEIGMNKKAGGGWGNPECIHYTLTAKPQ